MKPFLNVICSRHCNVGAQAMKKSTKYYILKSRKWLNYFVFLFRGGQVGFDTHTHARTLILVLRFTDFMMYKTKWKPIQFIRKTSSGGGHLHQSKDMSEHLLQPGVKVGHTKSAPLPTLPLNTFIQWESS